MRIIILIGLIFLISFGWADVLLLDPTLVCKKTRKLRGKLAEICRNESSSVLLKEIINGINLGFKECEFQFNNRRWNCTALRKSMRKILMKDIRETSFVNAITSAGITYTIARACSTGKLVECSCDKSHNARDRRKQSTIDNNNNNNLLNLVKNENSSKNSSEINSKMSRRNHQYHHSKDNVERNNKINKNLMDLSKKDWEWGGCGDNFKYGIRMSKIFLDSKYKKRSDIRTLIKLHNNQAGRLMIRDNIRIDCKCHGLSGSCTVKTCWSKMPTFHEIGSFIKERFNGAVKVIASNDGNSFIPEESTVKKPSKHDLVYIEDSPDFCRLNSKTGSLGTIGRVCNSTSMGDDGCEILCCNRGYARRIINQTVNCECVFKWCCEVQCKTCTEKKEINICK